MGSRPICIVMKRKFPCHERPDSLCVADYFFWDSEDCATSTKGHSYICKRPYDDIGIQFFNLFIRMLQLNAKLNRYRKTFQMLLHTFCTCFSNCSNRLRLRERRPVRGKRERNSNWEIMSSMERWKSGPFAFDTC